MLRAQGTIRKNDVGYYWSSSLEIVREDDEWQDQLHDKKEVLQEKVRVRQETDKVV